MINVANGGASSARSSLPTKMRGRLLTLVLVSASVWGCHSDVRAADYWVAPNGRDATGRGSRSRPWATLQYAADRVRKADIVHVLDGDYEGFYLTRGGRSTPRSSSEPRGSTFGSRSGTARPRTGLTSRVPAMSFSTASRSTACLAGIRCHAQLRYQDPTHQRRWQRDLGNLHKFLR